MCTNVYRIVAQDTSKIVASSVHNVIIQRVKSAEYLPLVARFVTLYLPNLMLTQRLSDATIRALQVPTLTSILLSAYLASLPAIPAAARLHAYRAIELTRSIRQSFSSNSTKSATRSAPTSQSPPQVNNVKHVSLLVKLVRLCHQNAQLVKKGTFCTKITSA